jgi:hypothetical protein
MSAKLVNEVFLSALSSDTFIIRICRPRSTARGKSRVQAFATLMRDSPSSSKQLAGLPATWFKCFKISMLSAVSVRILLGRSALFGRKHGLRIGQVRETTTVRSMPARLSPFLRDFSYQTLIQSPPWCSNNLFSKKHLPYFCHFSHHTNVNSRWDGSPIFLTFRHIDAERHAETT